MAALRCLDADIPSTPSPSGSLSPADVTFISSKLYNLPLYFVDKELNSLTLSPPTTGLPLPFISYGGNSLISSFCIVGMLLRCSLESTGFIGIYSARKSLD